MLLRLYALAGSVFSSYVTVPCWFCMSTSGSPVPPRGCVPSHPEDLALAARGRPVLQSRFSRSRGCPSSGCPAGNRTSPVSISSAPYLPPAGHRLGTMDVLSNSLFEESNIFTLAPAPLASF